METCGKHETEGEEPSSKRLNSSARRCRNSDQSHIKTTDRIRVWLSYFCTLPVAKQQTNDGLFGRCFETMVTSWEENNKGLRVGRDCSLYVINCLSTGQKQDLNSIQLWKREQWMKGLIDQDNNRCAGLLPVDKTSEWKPAGEKKTILLDVECKCSAGAWKFITIGHEVGTIRNISAKKRKITKCKILISPLQKVEVFYLRCGLGCGGVLGEVHYW